jgi:hypothetical protein
MPFESPRGCGYRKAGKLYLVGGGIPMPCDIMPLFLNPCECCGYIPTFYRNVQMIFKKYIRDLSKAQHRVECICDPVCPICHTENNDQARYGLMFTSTRYYTPESFIEEANRMGVSKAIPFIPKDLELGKTWVLCAYSKTPDIDDPDFLEAKKLWESKRNSLVANANEPLEEMPEPPEKNAIFYAFMPERIEMPIWKKDATEEKLKELEDQGITPIIWDEEDPNAEHHKKRLTLKEIQEHLKEYGQIESVRDPPENETVKNIESKSREGSYE